MISKPAPQAILSFAISCVQLYQCLRVGSVIGSYAAFLPHADVGVVLGRQRFEYVGGTLNELFVLTMAAISVEHRHNGIDNEDVDRCGR